jgi:DNA-binding SARP family transcriptional activator/DNA-binding beta-propeller fold protein YncE
LRFKILGPLEVHEDGRVVPVRAGKLAALLTVLLLRRNEVVPADRLIEELWSGDAPATAPKTLQLYVSQLRKLLPAETLATRAAGYVLNVGPDEVDADEFEELLARGREALEAGEPERAAVTLRRALALWRGAPLADFTYDEFARGEIERLEELRLEALEERIDADLARGRHANVVGELEALVREHPLRERLCAQLMLALYRCGRQADALAVFRDARRRLQDQLGIDPGPELRKLEGAILRQDEGLGSPARPRVVEQGRRWTRRRTLVAAVLTAVGAAVLTAALVGGSSTGVVPPNSVGVIDPAKNKVVARVRVGSQASTGQFAGTVPLDRRIAVGGGAVWVANTVDRTVSRIDPRTMSVQTIVGIDGAIDDIAVAGNGDLWATLEGDGLDHVVHGSVEQVTLPNPTGPAYSFSGLAADANGLWLGRSDENVLSLVKLDPSTQTVVGRPLQLGRKGLHSLAASGGYVWVTDSPDATLTRVDISTIRRAGPRERIGDAGSVAVGGGKVWVTSQSDDELWYVDTQLKLPLGNISVGAAPVSVAYGEGAVWVANYGDGTVSRVDPNTQRIEKTIEVGKHVSSVAVGAGRVWVVVPPAG